MLSVGKLAQGQERYYERAVARGQDDYYSGKGEAPGEWIGRGAGHLGLQGQVRAELLGAMAAGIDPSDPELHRRLRSGRGEVKVAGYDLTFSAPKSVSVLHATAPPAVAAELVEAHDAAVRAALGYVEDEAVKVRRGKGGAVVQPWGGLVAAAYRHRLSRSLDPQLHTHVVAANAAQGPDGRWTALDARHIYRHAKTAGTLYQAHLRAEVRDRLGLEWGPVRKGAAELVAVPGEVREHFSRRRAEMLEQAAGGGFSLNTKGRAESAALATRDRKTYGIDTATWREEVTARAAEHGLDRAAIDRLLADGLTRLRSGKDRGSDTVDLIALGRRLAGPDGLTATTNAFVTRDAVREVADAHQQGARVGDVRAEARSFLDRDDVLAALRVEDVDLPGEQDRSYTTADLVETERRLVAAAAGRRDKNVRRVPSATVDRSIARADRPLTPRQESAIRSVVGSGNGVDVIEALAGTGKTYTAGVLRQTYEAAGMTVAGAAPTGRAVRELTDEAGIRGSRTIHRLLHDIERDPDLAVDVLLIDAAGMAPTRLTERLLRWAERSDVKIIAIGDPGQLPSVQAGGWLRAVGDRVGRHELTEVLRQRDAGERRALGQLHDGNGERYVRWAVRDERITVHPRTGAALDHAVDRWTTATEALGLRDVVLIARDNDTRASLNDRARTVLRERGVLGNDHPYGPVAVAVGDRIICRRNDGLIDVDNGTRGTVRATHEDRLVLETDAGTVRELPAGFVAEHVEHAYALTGHGMQGGTVERAIVVAEPWDLTRGWSYTALSRARDRTELVVIADHDDHDPDRDEVAPGGRPQPRTRDEVLAQVAVRMHLRDDEDLAMDRLDAPSDTPVNDGPRPSVARPLQTRDSGDDLSASPANVRLAALLEEQARLGVQLQRIPLDPLEAFERLSATIDANRARRDGLAERLDALPEPRRRLLRIHDAYAEERARLRGLISTADERTRDLEQTLERHRDTIAGDPRRARAEREDLAARHTATRRESRALMDTIADREIRTEPQWARELLGARPVEPAGAAAWDDAGRRVIRHELQHRPLEPVDGLTPLAPDGTVTERASWRRAHDAVRRARFEIERGPEYPDLGPSLDR